MSVSIGYDQNHFPDGFGANDPLGAVLTAFTDDGIPGTHPINTGGFFLDGAAQPWSGDTYAFSTGSGYAFSVHGDVSYYFAGVSQPPVGGADNHTVYGTIDRIELGGGLDSQGNIVNPFLTITFDTPLVSTVLEGHDGVVHDVVWGLMNASMEGYYQPSSGASQEWGGLFAVLEAYGIDLDDAVADVGSPLSIVLADVGIDVLGVPEADDVLLAA